MGLLSLALLFFFHKLPFPKITASVQGADMPFFWIVSIKKQV
jgi:hypothetical protein